MGSRAVWHVDNQKTKEAPARKEKPETYIVVAEDRNTSGVEGRSKDEQRMMSSRRGHWGSSACKVCVEGRIQD
jgi:hypothetical protein